MGNSDKVTIPFYKKHIRPHGDVALLGFRNNNIFKGDLYDKHLGNWEINSEWVLPQKYDTVICTRCSYFCKNLLYFFERCYNSLNQNGMLYVDCGLGDHYRFKDFKVGWRKNGEHEWGHFDGNFLWSTIVSDKFFINEEYIKFEGMIEKYGYNGLKKAIFDECPEVFDIDKFDKFDMKEFNVMLNCQPDFLLNLIALHKKGEK